jgi:hypothetical protein
MRQLLTTGTRGNPRIDTLSVDSVAYLSQIIETVSVLGTPISSSTVLNVSSGSIYYYNANATANWTVNITDTVSLNDTLSAGQAITVVTLVTQGSTAYYNTAVTVDGSAATVVWLTGEAPTEGTADGIDAYSYTVIKTGNDAFLVLASVNNYA